MTFLTIWATRVSLDSTKSLGLPCTPSSGGPGSLACAIEAMFEIDMPAATVRFLVSTTSEALLLASFQRRWRQDWTLTGTYA